MEWISDLKEWFFNSVKWIFDNPGMTEIIQRILKELDNLNRRLLTLLLIAISIGGFFYYQYHEDPCNRGHLQYRQHMIGCEWRDLTIEQLRNLGSDFIYKIKDGYRDYV